MAYYNTCEYCGATLDSGEKCDCTESKGNLRVVATFGERILEGIERNGISMTDLSIRAHIALSSISRYASDQRSPRMMAVVKISRALKCDPMWLMGFNVPFERKGEEEKNS